MESSGVTVFQFESDETKRNTPALTYAVKVIPREVHARLGIVRTARISPWFLNLEKYVTAALDGVYTADVWNEYLTEAGLAGTSKKESEVFINACGALFVTTLTLPINIICADNTRKFIAKRALKELVKTNKDIIETANSMLDNYVHVLPRYTIKEFRQEYPYVISSLLDTL